MTDHLLSCTTFANPSNVTTIKCGSKYNDGPIVDVKRLLHIHFINSDFTWMVFVSRPVQIQCQMSDGDPFIRDFQLDVVDYDREGKDIVQDDDLLVVRVALLSQCTTGKSNISTTL